MNVVIHTTKSRAEAMEAIVRAELEYAKSQLQSRGVAALLDEVMADLLADIVGNEPESLVDQADLAEYPEPGHTNGKPKLKNTKALRTAMKVLSDGAWHFRHEIKDAGVPRGTVAGLVKNMRERGLVDERGNRFTLQVRLKEVA